MLHLEAAFKANALDRDRQDFIRPCNQPFLLAARFENLVEHLDLPSQTIPFELLNGVGAGTNRQVGDQLPIDLLSVFRRPALFGMDHRQGQSGIALLLSDRRQDANLAIPDLKNGLVGIAVAVSKFDAMEPF